MVRRVRRLNELGETAARGRTEKKRTFKPENAAPASRFRAGSGSLPPPSTFSTSAPDGSVQS